jgi:hypothetical protein
MALYIKPKGDSQELVKSLVAAAMHGAKRRVPGWILTSENADFSLNTGDAALDQKAYLRPQAQKGEVVLHLHWREGVKPDAAIYATYHARFIEMVMTYFTDRYEIISAS